MSAHEDKGDRRNTAGRVMQRPLPDDYRRQWTDLLAQPERVEAAPDRSVVVFRAGAEWLALPTRAALTVAEHALPRRIPHRRNAALRGLISVKGRLYPCVDLAALLHLATDEPKPHERQRATPRLLVAQLGRLQVAFPVQDMRGVARFRSGDLQPAPAPPDGTSAAWLTGVLEMEELRVGCLDAEQLARRLEEALR